MGAEDYHGNGAEKAIENKELSNEQVEQRASIGDAYERAAEKASIENGERSNEKAKAEALEQAISVERGGAEKKTKEASASPKRRHGVVSKKERANSYKKRMQSVQAELPPAQRAFSKVIHNPVVEKVSDVTGATVARPNAILLAAIVAFFAVLIVYLTAKHYGYMLSGFETIGAFIVGWVLGMLYDFFRVMITGKKS
jgi:hypothetical protein